MKNLYIICIAVSALFNLLIALLYNFVLKNRYEWHLLFVFNLHIFSECGEAVHDTTEENEFAAQIGQVPWMVSIGIFFKGKYTHQCGGSLITPLHVLTAAHCLNGIKNNSVPEG